MFGEDSRRVSIGLNVGYLQVLAMLARDGDLVSNCALRSILDK